MKKLLLIFVIILCGTPRGFPRPIFRQKRSTCGYEACRKVNPSTLNVHVVAHSHDDVGWLKTISQYYYGSNNSIQHAGVQYIITSVVEALKKNPERRFIQVETAFFAKWWSRQTEKVKETYRELVNNGQIEITGGAWSMNDEAATHYQSTIDQFTLGLGFIDDALGQCGRPKIGWQIDPFGHSREMASLFAQFGYDAFFFSRLHFKDKSTRFQSKTADLIWRGSANLGNKSDIFTNILYNMYDSPAGFCFDILCNDEPIIDNVSSPDYNYETKVNDFADFIREQAKNYKTSNIIITMGGNFNYQDAQTYYLNMDRLFKGFELFKQTYNNKSINVFYSTPSCYAKAVNDEAQAAALQFPLKTDDFFPYASDVHVFWTGYFTSRPTSKRFERQSNNLLQVTKQLSTLANSSTYLNNTKSLMEAMGMMQHHDAITGTEKQHVADDYHRILTKAAEKASAQSSASITDLLKRDKNPVISLNLQSCLLANISFCEASTGERFIVTVYNPLSRNVSQYVQLPVPSSNFTIIDPNGESVNYQVTTSPKNFSYTGLQTQPYALVFRAENLPPLGLKLYYITNNDPKGAAVNVQADASDGRFTLGDNSLGVQIDSSSKRLKSITINNKTLEVDQNFLFYVSSNEFQPSGAYIFRPMSDKPTAQHFDTPVASIATHKGSLFDEIHQVFDESVQQVIRVYKGELYIEFDWIVVPINKTNGHGREIISRFTTNIKSGNTFFTDSNGREMLKRVKNYRPTFNYTDEEPASGNYYPVTSRIVIKDPESNIEFAVLNDRAQGGSSLESGQVELMLHRRTTDDDSFGIDEVLDEQQYGIGLVARGQHFVTFGPITGGQKSAAAIERDVAQRKILAPWVFVSQYTRERKDLLQDFNLQFVGLQKSLPENVQILSLEPWKDNTVLLRLEHVLEADEDKNLSQSVTVNLEGLFSFFRVVSLKETTLAGNQWLEDNERLKWNIGEVLGNSGEPISKTVVTPAADDPLKVTLTPMQIRTFIATIQYV